MTSSIQTKQTLRVLIYITLIVIGLIILVWPEENNLMLVQFNKSHGPSTLDSIGIGFIFLGYIPMVIQVIRNFSTIRMRIGMKTTVALIITILISGAFIPVALIHESDPLLWISVAVCTFAEGVLIFFAFR